LVSFFLPIVILSDTEILPSGGSRVGTETTNRRGGLREALPTPEVLRARFCRFATPWDPGQVKGARDYARGNVNGHFLSASCRQPASDGYWTWVKIPYRRPFPLVFFLGGGFQGGREAARRVMGA
jgi:hypothetical protein